MINPQFPYGRLSLRWGLEAVAEARIVPVTSLACCCVSCGIEVGCAALISESRHFAYA